MESMIKVENLIFDYVKDLPPEEGKDGEQPKEQKSLILRALDGVDIEIEEGTFTAIIGQNGSGKSTLAKNLNGLLLPTEGAVYISGMDTREEDNLWDIRQIAGMVFQNPDNQLVASVVEDDVAFGPENLGMDPDEIRKRVDEVLAQVHMTEFADKAPHLLSGGQKQRIAIAGVLAMKPKCIIFDEPTAMLDPQGRVEIMKAIRELHKEGKTIILITHFMEEAAIADRVIIMGDGKVLLDGTPEYVFTRRDIIRKAKLQVPVAVEIADGLRARGIGIPEEIITVDRLVEFVCSAHKED